LYHSSCVTKGTLNYVWLSFMIKINFIVNEIIINLIDLATSLSVHCFGSEKLLLLLWFPGMFRFLAATGWCMRLFTYFGIHCEDRFRRGRSTPSHKGYSPLESIIPSFNSLRDWSLMSEGEPLRIRVIRH